MTPEETALVLKLRAKATAAKATVAPSVPPPDVPIYPLSPDNQAEQDRINKDMATQHAFDVMPWYKKIPQAVDDLARISASSLTAGGIDWLGGPESQKATENARLRAGQAGDVLGIGAAMLPAAKGFTLVSPALAKMPGLLGYGARTAASAGEGSIWGGLNSFFHGGDVPTGVLSGAALAGVTNAAGEPIGKIASAGGKYISNLHQDPTIKAQDTVANAAAANPNAAKDLANLGPDGMLLDVLGRKGYRLGKAVAKTSDASYNVLSGITTSRDSSVLGSVASKLSDLSGVPKNSIRTVDEEVARQHQLRAPAYHAEYQKAENSGAVVPMSVPAGPGHINYPLGFQDILSTPSGKEAWGLAHRNVQEWAHNPEHNVNSTLAHLDETQKILSFQGKQMDVKGDPRAPAVLDQASLLRARIDEVLNNPAYRKAKMLRQQEAENEDALRLGERLAVNKPDPADITKAREIQASQPHLVSPLQKGYAMTTRGNLLNSKAEMGSVANLGTPGGKATLQAVFGQDTPQLTKVLEDHGVFANTTRRVMPGTHLGLDPASLVTYGGGGASLISGLLSGHTPSMITGGLALAIPSVRKALLAMQARGLVKQAPEITRLLTGKTVPVASARPPTKLEKLTTIPRLPTAGYFGQLGAQTSANPSGGQ